MNDPLTDFQLYLWSFGLLFFDAIDGPWVRFLLFDSLALKEIDGKLMNLNVNVKEGNIPVQNNYTDHHVEVGF